MTLFEGFTVGTFLAPNFQFIFFTEAFVSIDRVQKFLLDSSLSKKPKSKEVKPGCIELFNVSLGWEAEKPIVSGINLKVNQGQLIVINGPVGAGKTSFLSLLLGEIDPIAGQIEKSGTFSFCSQDAWIFLGTIRQNILFGLDYNADRYARVVKTACLSTDFDLFELGDKTVVGDKEKGL